VAGEGEGEGEGIGTHRAAHVEACTNSNLMSATPRVCNLRDAQFHTKTLHTLTSNV